MNKKGNQGSGKAYGNGAVEVIPVIVEKDGKKTGYDNAETAAEPIHSIDHIVCVDKPYACKNRERNRYVPGEAMDSPKALERIDTKAAGIDKGCYRKNFHYYAGACTESQEVIQHPDEKHYGNREKDWKEFPEPYAAYGSKKEHPESPKHTNIYPHFI